MNDFAFPQESLSHSHVEGPHNITGGLTKRELFAAIAMNAIIGTSSHAGDLEEDMKAGWAVYYADSLIRALAKP